MRWSDASVGHLVQNCFLVVNFWCYAPSGNYNSAETTAKPKLHGPVTAIVLPDEFNPVTGSVHSAWLHWPVPALQLRLVVVSGFLSVAGQRQ